MNLDHSRPLQNSPRVAIKMVCLLRFADIPCLVANQSVLSSFLVWQLFLLILDVQLPSEFTPFDFRLFISSLAGYCTTLQAEVSLLRTWLLEITKSFRSQVSGIVGVFMPREHKHTNYM